MNDTAPKIASVALFLERLSSIDPEFCAIAGPIVESDGFKRIEIALHPEPATHMLFLLRQFRDDRMKGRASPEHLRGQATQWERSQTELQITLDLLKRFADVIPEMEDSENWTDPRIIRELIEQIDLCFRVHSNRATQYLGQKGGYNEFVIRNIAAEVPATTVNRFSAIAEVLKLAGFLVSRQLVAVTLKEADRRPAKGFRP